MSTPPGSVTKMTTPTATLGTATLGTAMIAMIGNPNVGKTSIFNRLANLRAKTSNFPGTTIDRRIGSIGLASSGGDVVACKLVDLPGLYSLDASSPEETVAIEFLRGQADKSVAADSGPPDVLVVVVDATQLQRSLFIARQALELSVPAIVVVNMIEAARRRGLHVDLQKLREKLAVPVVGVSARTGEGFDELRASLACLIESSTHSHSVNEASQVDSNAIIPVLNSANELDDGSCNSCRVCPYADGHQWAANLARESTENEVLLSDETADRLDGYLTHRIFGPAFFLLVMITAFSLVFWVAQYPMELLDGLFSGAAEWLAGKLPEGDLSSLITDGIVAGVGGVVIFLPQICILFFMLAILEDSGYLARAVVVIDRWMRKVGLPGQAFVPLLAAHACAIPAIMSTKVIENRRDRLASIMVIPLMTCSARLPVYTMVAAMLFPESALYAAILFASAYGLGMLAAFTMAWLLKRTVLPGEPSPLLLDLPPYRAPSFSNAIRYAYERGWVFLRDAGTVILVISIVIWVLSTYPKMPDSHFSEQLAATSVDESALSESELANVRASAEQEYAVIGRLGKVVAPVMAPLGFDWKTSVGVLASFAAREVVVSTLSILYGLGPDPEEGSSLRERLQGAKNAKGELVFTPATCMSLLVFFVLAMQCLPTQAVTKKETGSWGWAAFQFGYMTLLAYVAALVTYQTVSVLT